MQTTPKKHAKYSASGAKRWLCCPGSVALSLRAPKQVESSYALEGTLAHEALEDILLHKSPIEELELMYSKETLEHVTEAAKYVFDLLPMNTELEFLVEQKVDLSFVYPETFGTVDVAIVELFGTLTVFDYKHGAGLPVEVEENPQALFYALGLAHKYDYNFAEIKLVIYQPRAEHKNGPVREWTIDTDTLLSWKKKFQEGVARAEQKNAPYCAGEWCRFCPAKTICPEISDKALSQAQIDFAPDKSVLALPQLKENTPLSFLATVMPAVEKLEVWCESVRRAAFDALQSGQEVPGYKLVDKRSTRHWIDPEKTCEIARRTFGPLAFSEPALLSPAKLEKLAGKNWVAPRVTNISSGVTMVRDSDSRRESSSSAANDFRINRIEALEIALETSKELKRKGKNKYGLK